MLGLTDLVFFGHRGTPSHSNTLSWSNLIKNSFVFRYYPLSDLNMYELMLALRHPNSECEVLEAYK
jgi:hypothetical protein